MVCKKDVVTWFKSLKSYKRSDVMCTLLNLCLPFELRFLGTCLEHLGKRDFHELRQSENEANNLSDLTLPELQCLSNQQVRTKLAVYVSLLYSCNYSCCSGIYKILTKNEDIHTVIKAASDDTVLDDLLLLYTLAVNHPGFSYDQKLNLEKILIQLHEEERKISATTVNRNKNNFVAGNSQENVLDKPPPPIQGHYSCIAYDDHIIGVTTNPGQCPPMPPHPHHFPGDGTTVPGYPVTFPWQFLPAQDSPLSRNSSPNSGSPPPSRVKFPPPRVPHPPPTIEQLRETVSKELPTYATTLHPFSYDQLSRMCDGDLREMGLGPDAVVQLRAILNRQTNGIGSADVKKKMEPPSEIEQTQTIRRYPTETLALYPGVYSCYTIPAGTRKYHQVYQSPHHQLDFRQMRITSEPSSSDESSPDTPPPHVEGVVQDERLVGGAGEERRGGGRGRSRHHPPGRPAVPRARGPHPDSRRRDVNMSNGAGGNGNGEPAGGFYPPHGYLPPHYVRTPYPTGFPGGGAAGFMRAYPPFQQPNGELVYTYPPPTGAYPIAGYSMPQGGQVIQPPPPPQQPPPQLPQVTPKPHQPPPISCYNCGSQSHCAIDCPEATIEEVTKQGQYRLDYTGGYQKTSGVEQHVQADK